MGKKAKLKEIRRMATVMPHMLKGMQVTEKVFGVQLLNEGIEDVNGREVKPDNLYVKKTTVPVPVNHNKAMKTLYNKYGAKGVLTYVDLIRNNVAPNS